MHYKYKVALFLLMNIILMCTKKEESVKTKIEDTMFLLDHDRMEQIIILMPIILKKATDFQKYSITQKYSDDEYNTKFYQYLFYEKAFAERLIKAGFKSSQEYQQFYDTMIEIYLLLLKQPEVIDTANSSIDQYKNDINSLTLRVAQEPNNDALALQLKRIEYELTSYQNILIVNEFLTQLNSLNQ